MVFKKFDNQTIVPLFNCIPRYTTILSLPTSSKTHPILVYTQVIDSHVGEQGEVIANIPIRISARAVFAQYIISPVEDISFGPMAINSRKNTTVVLENTGEFEYKYAITKKMSADQQKMRVISMAAVAAKNRTKSRESRDVSSSRISVVKTNSHTAKHKNEESLRYGYS